MKAVAVVNTRLQDLELPTPSLLARDLLVKVEAISVNPVDHKVGDSVASGEAPRVLGWDVAGTVQAIGPEVTLFKVGDPVFYAGSVVRAGANSELHAVDERIVGRKPATADFRQAAALPLTSITAWEALFERLAISRTGADQGRSILIIGGAGGVGSIAIQLASRLAGLTVVATASRPESADWCRKLGAGHVIDHNGDMAVQLAALALPAPDFILCLNETDRHFPAMAEIIAPQGKICSIVCNEQPLPMDALFGKAATFVYELMFTRSTYQTPDMQEQHVLLNEIARLVDEGVLRTTLAESFGRISAANLQRAHAALKGRRTIGKIVLEGF